MGLMKVLWLNDWDVESDVEFRVVGERNDGVSVGETE